MSRKEGKHSFSIEMSSKSSLKYVHLSESLTNGVLIEGVLGELVEITLHEDVMLEIRGINGTLRLDLRKEELETCLQSKDKNKVNKP